MASPKSEQPGLFSGGDVRGPEAGNAVVASKLLKAKVKAKPKKTTAVVKAEAKPKQTGTAVAIHKPKPPKPTRPPTDAGSMLTFIANAAMNPNVDPTKMRELLEIRRELKDEEARERWAASMLKVQRQLPRITKNGLIEIEKNGVVIQKTPYARFEDLNAICKPILLAHGFVLSFKLGTVPVGEAELRTTVTGVLKHEGGHQEEAQLALPVEASGSKNNVQGIGSSVSYGKRYCMTALLNLVAYGEDDDGNQAKGETISSEQLTELLDKCVKHGVDQVKFRTFCRVDTLAAIPASKFKHTMAEIDRIKPLPAGVKK